MARPAHRDTEVLTLTSGLGIRLHRPIGVAGRAPAILLMHGGGYVMGTAKFDDLSCRTFARELGVTVASVEYRLAPEHPYPAALDDSYEALKWLVSLPAVDASRVAIGGESAGGGLAAALALHARDQGEIAPVLQLLSQPMLDDRTVAGHHPPGRRLWTHASNRYAWSAYLGGADADAAVPARCTDLSGVAPAWIGVGTLDVFHDEAIEYGSRLEAAGVPCHVEVVPGAFHTFDKIKPKTTIARNYHASQLASLRNAFHRPMTPASEIA